MNKKITVVVINSLSFTGTTWFNAVLGCNSNAFALGPADRVIGLKPEEWGKACLVHGESCEFWKGFSKRYTEEGNFFLQLAEYANCEYIITNNLIPDKAGKQLKHKDIIVKEIRLFRDGRAVARSYARHNNDCDYLDAITEFLFQPYNSLIPDPNNSEILSLKLEGILADKKKMLEMVGDFLSIKYDDSALKFWEWRQHISSGNQGTISLIKFALGIKVNDFRSKHFYEEQFDKMLQDNSANFEDVRWKHELSKRELFLFDIFCGINHEKLGYECTDFTIKEVNNYSSELTEAIVSGELQHEHVKYLRENYPLLFNKKYSLGKHNNTDTKKNKVKNVLNSIKYYIPASVKDRVPYTIKNKVLMMMKKI